MGSPLSFQLVLFTVDSGIATFCGSALQWTLDVRIEQRGLVA